MACPNGPNSLNDPNGAKVPKYKIRMTHPGPCAYYCGKVLICYYYSLVLMINIIWITDTVGRDHLSLFWGHSHNKQSLSETGFIVRNG